MRSRMMPLLPEAMVSTHLCTGWNLATIMHTLKVHADGVLLVPQQAWEH